VTMAIIERCGPNDIADVTRFIDAHWKRGHALVTCRPLLDWQHRLDEGGYSFVIAREAGTLEILGILGYISTRRFDPALEDANTVWLTTWKVRDDANVAGLGLALLHHLTRTERHVTIGAIGFNPATEPIYRALGYAVGDLEHYVAPNAAVRQFELAALSGRLFARDPTGAPLAHLALSRSDFDRAAGFDRLMDAARTPRKTAAYFCTRYLQHPVYSYIVIGLIEPSCKDRPMVGLLAARIAEHAGRRALRIVDFIGRPDVFSRVGAIVQILLREHDAEYADVYNAGFDPAVFERSGFTRIDPAGASIVPDHFEPFEYRNVRLRFSIKGAAEPILFKGDADQDRPNLVEAARS
jgi:hypothetical protein